MPGPTLVVRTRAGMAHVDAHEVVVATGAAEIQPVCPGDRLAGLLTAGAAERLHAAGIPLGAAVAVGTPPVGVPCTPVAGRLVRFEGVDRVDRRRHRRRIRYRDHDAVRDGDPGARRGPA